MSVTIIAPEGYARIEETLVINLDLHCIAVSAILGYALALSAARSYSGQYTFPEAEGVKVSRRDNVAYIRLVGEKHTVKYRYRLDARKVTDFTMYNEACEVIEAKAEHLEAAYKAFVDYTTSFILYNKVTDQSEPNTETTV